MKTFSNLASSQATFQSALGLVLDIVFLGRNSEGWLGIVLLYCLLALPLLGAAPRGHLNKVIPNVKDW